MHIKSINIHIGCSFPADMKTVATAPATQDQAKADPVSVASLGRILKGKWLLQVIS